MIKSLLYLKCCYALHLSDRALKPTYIWRSSAGRWKCFRGGEFIMENFGEGRKLYEEILILVLEGRVI